MTIDERTEDHGELLLKVAQRYYEQDRTQESIGHELHLTRWKIGRLLEEAKSAGIVQIRVVHPQARRTELEIALRGRFGLRECVVVPTPEVGEDGSETDAGNAGGRASAYAHIATAAANYLRAHAAEITTLGVSWGNTLQHIAAVLPQGWTRGIEVIQVNGGVSRSVKPTTAASVAMSIAQSGDGRATLLPVPAIVEHVGTREALYREGFVDEVLQKGRTADAILFSLGALGDRSVLVQSGAVTPEELARLQGSGAVGDAIAHYVTADGSIADADIESRTVGLDLDDLRAARRSIAVAAGVEKAPIVTAALTSGLCTVLITDERTARSVLEA